MAAGSIETTVVKPMRDDASRALPEPMLAERSLPLAAFLLFVVVVSFPVLFMNRAISPAEALYGVEPWRSYGRVEVPNPAAREAALSVLPMLATTGTWDRSIAAGESVRPSEAWSPWKLIARSAPAGWETTLLVLSLLSCGFAGAYAWLRVERFDRVGSTFGAIVAGTSGIASVLWILPDGYSLSLAPILLWLLARHARGGSLVPVAAMLVAMVLSPSASFVVPLLVCIVYGVARYASLQRRAPIGLLVLVVATIFLALGLHALRGGKLDLDGTAVIPASHLTAAVAPERLGTARAWQGDPALGSANDFAHSTLFIGLIPLVLLFAGALFSFSRVLVPWLAALAALLLLVSFESSSIPAANWRLAIPLVCAVLVARGASAVAGILRRFAAGGYATAALVLLAAGELAFFAAAYLPYTPRAMAQLPQSAVQQYLQTKLGPFRVAGFFDYLPADTATLLGVEDIRTRRALEPKYADLLRDVQPDAVKASGRVEFDSQRAELGSNALARLNVRYLLEHRAIDVVRWRINKDSVARGTEGGKIVIPEGETFRQTIEIDSDDFWAVELFVKQMTSRAPFSTVTLAMARPETGDEVWSRTFAAGELARREKVYAPLKPWFGDGNLAEIRVTPHGSGAIILRSSLNPAETIYALTRLPVILDAELDDGRVFENLSALPRFFATWHTSGGSDPSHVRVETDRGRSLLSTPVAARRVRVKTSRRAHDYVIRTEAAVPFFLASSEKWTDTARFIVDGREEKPLRVNDLFAGTFIEAGTHDVIFRRGSEVRKVWLLLAALLFLVAVTVDRMIAQRRLRATKTT